MTNLGYFLIGFASEKLKLKERLEPIHEQLRKERVPHVSPLRNGISTDGSQANNADQVAAQTVQQPAPEHFDAILLLAHGTPDVLSEMDAYLKLVTGGRGVPPHVVHELQERYAEIGLRDEPTAEGPHLTKWTLLQGKLLEQRIGTPVYVGMRNWKPFIGDTVEQMKQAGVKKLRAICLAPQNSRTSVGLYRRALETAAAGAFEIDFVAGWSEHPLLVRAFAERMRQALEAARATGARTAVLFTAHSVPCRTIQAKPSEHHGMLLTTEADTYAIECKSTARHIAADLSDMLDEQDWYFCFQSQGLSGGPWIGPGVEDLLAALKGEGYTHAVLQPVGFLCDHVEILYDIDIDFQQKAREIGITISRALSLNESPTLIAALADVARRGTASLPVHGTAPVSEPADVVTVLAPVEEAVPGQRVVMPRSIAVIGGGTAGLAAAFELQKQKQAGAHIHFTLVETSKRLGGIVETHRESGFINECGPDGWVTDKPWARDLAVELGLADDLIESNDASRVTWVLQNGGLVAVPEGMRMMVPENLDAVMHSPLFHDAARAAYASEPGRAEELKHAAPQHDESVASFIKRHFGSEVLRIIGAPLLGGVFGGDVQLLSVQAVMQPFVQMEREYGSLILALQARAAQRGNKPRAGIFTTLRSGMATLVDRMAASVSPASVQMERCITAVQRTGSGWLLHSADGQANVYDHLMLATPVQHARSLLKNIDPEAADLMNLPTSSAIIAGFGFDPNDAPGLPKGFGFLAPTGEGCRLLAATFADQKFADRVPPGGKSLRAYFGAAAADAMMNHSDEEIAAMALQELGKVLGPLPTPAVTVVRRWPGALPQYHVGHNERMAKLQTRVDSIGRLHLLGNGYRGVGLPDLIRDGRAAARQAAISWS